MHSKVNQLQITITVRFYITRPYVGEAGNKFGEIHNLNLCEACRTHTKIFALVLIVTYWKEILKKGN